MITITVVAQNTETAIKIEPINATPHELFMMMRSLIQLQATLSAEFGEKVLGITTECRVEKGNVQ